MFKLPNPPPPDPPKNLGLFSIPALDPLVSLLQRDSQYTTIDPPSLHKKESMQSDDSETTIVEDEREDNFISLYQGFRAMHPRLAIYSLDTKKLTNDKHSLTDIGTELNIVLALSGEELQEGTDANSKRTNVLRYNQPPNQNVQEFFGDLLDRRDGLILEFDGLDSMRKQFESELASIESQLESITLRKKGAVQRLNSLSSTLEPITDELISLDEEIERIGNFDSFSKNKNEDNAMFFHGKTDSNKPQDKLIVRKPAHKSLNTYTSIPDFKSRLAKEPYDTMLKQLIGHTDSVECLDFESSRGLLATGSADSTVRIWDLSTYSDMGVLRGWVRSVQLSGSHVISGSNDHTLKLWNISLLNDTSNSALLRTYVGHTAGVTSLQFDACTLMSGSADEDIRIWNLETGILIQTLSAPDSLFAVEAIPEPNSYASLVTAPAFRGWTEPLEQKGSLQVASLYFYGCALAGGYGDGGVRLWDTRTATCTRTLHGHQGTVTSVQFDDGYIFSGSADKTFKVWDLRTGTVVESHEMNGIVSSIHADADRVLIAAGRGKVGSYKRTTGEMRILDTHGMPVRVARGIGERVVTGGMDCMVKIWRTAH